ncbi:L-aspartate oxidase [Anoxybacillus sp. B7M1]|uniref:L-aspartate oxidase n=1 Tax=unclassified Anoxybacillus TaxID=2639704 RepID=UPI0005CCF90F|nr:MULTISPECIES: L-aspartate oxidase [unclassified Anoxybacillus]ANB57448.1 L-aspartate oxidase [Anoxybacillus sp. B2M1]ANB65007.1 L-aspartate oxidase [Anoxybacillus sp. B7M1]
MPQADVIIVGGGLASLVTAYHLFEHKNVIIFTKAKKEESNSWLAQGGIAAALSGQDHWHFHYQDTIIAGADHNDERAVEILVQEGPKRLLELVETGLQFDTDQNGHFHFGNEGAHSQRRILHAGGDQTGKAMTSFLMEKLYGHVTIVEDERVIDLLVADGRCIGVLTKTGAYYADAVVLSTGGCGRLYSFSSNAETVTGDGIALAYRAGAAVTDMEFIQFHPTMLYVNGRAVGLISEAVRGEGAVLVTEDGKKLMESIHPQQDLAPRDVVARAIHAETAKGGRVYLDISMIKNFAERFPTIAKLCESHGVGLQDGRLPVVPGAHFLMGGIQVDLSGQTSLAGLYAVGEVACTGVHGANRLASNSLLEGLVFGARLAEVLKQRGSAEKGRRFPFVKPNSVKSFTGSLPDKGQIQEIMMRYVGIVRDERSLATARKWLEQFSIPELVKTDVTSWTEEEITVAYMLITGWLITTSALKRTESRGGHYRSDYPTEAMHWKKRRILRTKEEFFARIGGTA